MLPSPFNPFELAFRGRPDLILGRWDPGMLPDCDVWFSMTRQSGGVIPDERGGTGLALTASSIGYCADGVLAYTGAVTASVTRPDVAARTYVLVGRCEPRDAGGVAWGPGAPLGVGLAGAAGAATKTATAATTGASSSSTAVAASEWVCVVATLTKTGGWRYAYSTARTLASGAENVSGALSACALGIGGTTTDGPVVLGALGSIARELTQSEVDRVFAWFDATYGSHRNTGLPWWDVAGAVASWPMDGSLSDALGGTPLVMNNGSPLPLAGGGYDFQSGRYATAQRGRLAGNFTIAYRRTMAATGSVHSIAIGGQGTGSGCGEGHLVSDASGTDRIIIHGVAWGPTFAREDPGAPIFDYDGSTFRRHGLTTVSMVGTVLGRSADITLQAVSTTGVTPGQGKVRDCLAWGRVLTTDERARITAWHASRPWSP